MKSVVIGLGSAARLAQDRAIWRDLVEALCATGHNEDVCESECVIHVGIWPSLL